MHFDNAETKGASSSRQAQAAVFEQIAVGVAHDLRNPLAVILNAVYLLRRGAAGQSPQDLEILRILETEVRAANQVLTSLVELACRTPEKQDFDLAALLAEEYAKIIVPPSLAFRLEAPRRPFMVPADMAQFQYVIGVVLQRFSRNAKSAGEIILALREPDADTFELEITRRNASTAGAPERPAARGERRGSPSLALLICKEIMERHHGSFQYFDLGVGEMSAIFCLPRGMPPAARAVSG